MRCRKAPATIPRDYPLFAALCHELSCCFSRIIFRSAIYSYIHFIKLISADNATTMTCMTVCHEYRRSIRRCVTVREMEEGPSRSAAVVKCDGGERCS